VSDFYNRFYNMGVVIPSKEISVEEMKSFMDRHIETFERVATEYIKKFNIHKKIGI